MRTAATIVLLPAVLVAGVHAQEPIGFEDELLPILEERCFKCHAAGQTDARGRQRAPKGGLRLDGRGWILRGGDGGHVLTPRSPERSRLYTLTVLPKDHEDRMPAVGRPLSRGETEVLRLWIAQGADFGGWSGAAGPAAEEPPADDGPVPPRVELLQRLGRGVAAPSATAVAKLEELGQATAVLPGSALLRVQFISHQEQVGDREVRRLEPLARHVVELDLSRTRVTDAALATVARLERLVRLDLHVTEVTDAGVAHLKRLRELRYLNLYGTRVTDAAVLTLSKLRSLESVYLWRTGVTDEGVVRLREALPGARVHHRPDLPEPEPVRAATRGPQRRR